MELHDKRYIVGIDLGTTNSAVSYVDLAEEGEKSSRIRMFFIPQLTGPGEFSRLSVLPSFLYIPGTYDIAKEAIAIPWPRSVDHFVGAFARDHGARVPSRLVSSAKSWLCHGRVDRNARILPWGAPEVVSKVSPVQATAAYLEHIRNAWNHAQAEDEDGFLENQIVIVTVPASFDEAARDLTLEAAKLAGFPSVTLLEEPLAAFYSWLIAHEKNWSEYVQPGELICVCDVGGGTTDFTLITLRETEGSPRFERIAVGDHLILGGDNIDLALARQVEARFTRQHPALSSDRWKSLCHQCRQAKETLLDGKAKNVRITLMGEGGRLIADTLSADLTVEDVRQIVVSGFFPLVEAGPVQAGEQKKGITEFGLPYEQEPAVTRHLGWFLERHVEAVRQIVGKDRPRPDLVLFNGGSLKPGLIQDRIRQSVRHWFGVSDESSPRVMENPDLDLAVARGAAYYGLVKIGRGVKVGSGSARSFYLGVSRKQDLEGPNEKAHALCLVERGLDEGSKIALQDRRFEVLANQPVSFDLFSSSYRSGDRSGDLVEIDDTLTALPPIQTVIQFGSRGVKTRLPVHIEAEFTEVGTLALWCRSLYSPHRWRLQFQLRDISGPTVQDTEIFEASVVESAREAIRNAFAGKTDSRAVENLARDIAALVGRPREKWPLSFIRVLSDTLLELIDARRISADFECRWLNLTGFCLRPGFGDALDPHRIKALWKIFRQGPVFANNAQVRSEWWILWRRAAGGLSPGQQRQFIQELTPVMMPKKGAKSRIPPQESLEIWMAVANMEQLMAKDKVAWGALLLSEISSKKARPQHFWSLSRIGARELLYGSSDRVVPPGVAADWIDALLSMNWRNLKPLEQALIQMARKTGDRVRDLEPAGTARILEWLAGREELGAVARYLSEVVPVQRQEESAIFGESLPAGLVLHE